MIASAQALCWHCGEPLPVSITCATIAGESRSFCCPGCQAAAAWIEQLGLSDYYRLRTLPAQKPSATDTPDRASRLAWQRDEIARHVRLFHEAVAQDDVMHALP